MQLRNLSQDCKIVPILSYGTGTADRTSEVIDHTGYDRCMVLVHFSTIAAGATTSIKRAHADAASDENTMTSGADIAGSAQTVADDDDNQVKYMDFRPTKKYSQITIDKDAVNATAESAIAILYRGTHGRPVTHAAGGAGAGTGTGAVEGELDLNSTSGTA